MFAVECLAWGGRCWIAVECSKGNEKYDGQDDEDVGCMRRKKAGVCASS